MGSYFSKIFADSPVSGIQEHCDRCYKASRQLIDLFKAAFEEDWIEYLKSSAFK